MIVFMIVLISCSVHDNEDGKTNGNFGVIKKNPLILDYGHDSVERPTFLSSLVPVFQAPICTAGQLKCLKNITVDNSLCLNNCKGMMITSFYKDYHTKDLNLNPFISELIQDYNNYKKDFQFPHGIRGNMKLNPCNINRDFLQSMGGKTN